MTSGPALADLRRREVAILTLSVLTTSGLAWLALARRSHQKLAPLLDPLGSGPAELTLSVAMWSVMTVAMMLPTTLPWSLTFVRLAGGTPSQRRRRLATFLGGYLVVWGLFAVGAAVLQSALQRVGALAAPGPALPVSIGGLVLIGAGLFQFLDVKEACLSRCRSPVSYFLASWRDGSAGAFRMGIGHGAHCLGCCWALMATAFALGVMNLAWMAILTLVLCGERLLPRGPALGRLAGALAVAGGTALLLAG
jgi:predicted metal-binding membrane protein